MEESVSLIDPIVDFVAEWMVVPGIAIYMLYLLYKSVKAVFSFKHKSCNKKNEDYTCDNDNNETELKRDYTKEELYEVRIKGTVQCNGPKVIDKRFVADKVQAQMFQGNKRYEAIEGWVRANYPAAKAQTSYRNFGVEVKRLR